MSFEKWFDEEPCDRSGEKYFCDFMTALTDGDTEDWEHVKKDGKDLIRFFENTMAVIMLYDRSLECGIDDSCVNKVDFYSLLNINFIFIYYCRNLDKRITEEDIRRFAEEKGIQYALTKNKRAFITGIDKKKAKENNKEERKMIYSFLFEIMTYIGQYPEEELPSDWVARAKKVDRFIYTRLCTIIWNVHLYFEQQHILERKEEAVVHDMAEEEKTDSEQDGKTAGRKEEELLRENENLRSLLRDASDEVQRSEQRAEKAEQELKRLQKDNGRTILELENRIRELQNKNKRQQVQEQCKEEPSEESHMEVERPSEPDPDVYQKNILFVTCKPEGRLTEMKKAYPNASFTDSYIFDTLKGYDCVVIVTDQVSHKHTYAYKAPCQRKGIPFVQTSHSNPNAIARDICQQLGQTAAIS